MTHSIEDDGVIIGGKLYRTNGQDVHVYITRRDRTFWQKIDSNGERARQVINAWKRHNATISQRDDSNLRVPHG